MIGPRCWPRLALGCLVACGGRGAPEPYRAPLTEPWSALELPVDQGRVVFSDPSALTVFVDGGEVGPVAAAWSDALARAGYQAVAEVAGEDMAAATFDGADGVLALGVLSAPGRAEVSLTRYPK